MNRRWMLPLVAGLIILYVALSNMPSAAASVRWEGTTDIDMLHQAQRDLDRAVENGDKVLIVSLSSPGGGVLTGLQIAKLVRDAYDKRGLIVEIHASMLCASACTFILSSGTPGYRYIDEEALFLVHSMQNKETGEDKYKCVDTVAKPTTQEDKATDRLFEMVRRAYVRYTGRSWEEVSDWTTCGKELVGGGTMAVALGIADKIE